MAKYLNSGETVNITAPKNLAAGETVRIAANFYGVAYAPAKQGELVALQIKGSFGFKAAGAIAIGREVYLDASGKATATAATGKKLGVALSTAAAADDDVAVLLNACKAASALDESESESDSN